MKNKYKKFLLVISIILFIYFLGGVFYNCFKPNKKENNKVIDNGIQIKGFNYILNDNKTKLYKEEFKKLKSNLESNKIDYKEYAISISKMFLVDLYNLDNKKNMYDVGGVEFVYPDAVENYKLNVTNTLYKYMEDNTINKRNQELPIVTSVKVNECLESIYLIDEKEFAGYKLKLKIEYEKDLEYDSDCEVILVKSDKYLYIVEKNNIE